jgi:DNA polymerase-1
MLPNARAVAGLSARLILQVHDELLFEAPDAEAERVAAMARELMQAAAVEISVPVTVETGIGKNWGQAH